MTESKIKDLSKTKKKITITVPKDKIPAFVKRAHEKVGSKATIKGFRPGKVPTDILEKHFGAEISYESLNFLISETYVTAVQESGLMPITEPKFDAKPLDRNADYTYHVEFEIKPEFELKEYKGIKVKKQEAKINDKELDEELKRLQDSLAQLAPVKDDDVLKNGLVATIDFDGKIDGKTFQGGSAKDYVFEFGTGTLLKDFEAAMEGMKKDETRQFKMTFPKDYFEKDLANKEADYTSTLKSLHLKSLPKLDDEMAKDIGKESIEQVKTEIKESLLKRKEREFRKDYAIEIRESLAKTYKFEVPETIVNAEVERTKQDKKEIEKQIRIELVLEAIARKEAMQTTPQDIQQRMNMLSQMYRQPLAEIQKIYQQSNMMASLASQIVLEKAMDFLIDNANLK
jgi:trigger factor